jgi:hypothetical protein
MTREAVGMAFVFLCSIAVGCDRRAPPPAVTTARTPSSSPSEPEKPAPEEHTAKERTPTAARVDGEKTTGVSEQKRDGAPAVLHAVRAAKNDGYDRVVFEFRERVPGYHLAYVEPPVLDCGAGEAKQVEGSAWLEARFYPAYAHTEEGQPTVEERELKPGLAVVRELERTCDFEAVVTWVIGTATRKPYSVLELSDPPRLVIDLEQ